MWDSANKIWSWFAIFPSLVNTSHRGTHWYVYMICTKWVEQDQNVGNSHVTRSSTAIPENNNNNVAGYLWSHSCHHFHPSLSPIVSLFSSILYEWMRSQTLAKPSSNLLQRTGGDHAQLGWRTFMMTCLRWILGYTRLEMWRKIGLTGDWRVCTVPCTHSGSCCYWTLAVGLRRS